MSCRRGALIPPLGRHPRACPEVPFCGVTEPLRRIGVPPLAWIAGSSPAMTVGKRGTTLASIICFRISIHEIPFRAPEHAGAVQAHLPAPGRRQEQYRRSEEHTAELQSLMRISYAVFCFKKKKTRNHINTK